MTPPLEITASIVEADSALGARLRRKIETSANLRMVGHWSTGGETLARIVEVRPQIILMAANLPDISGIEVTTRIKRHLPQIEIIMVTDYRDHHRIFAALKAGASGFLHKRSSSAEMRAAITDALIKSGITCRDAGPCRHPLQEQPERFGLSKRESEVLKRLSEGRGNKEIGTILGISADTVKVHLRRIHKKIDVCTRTQAVVKFHSSDCHGDWLLPV